MDSVKCKFCIRKDELKKKFLPISELDNSYLYLFRNQYYPGRCCLLLKTHDKNLSDISETVAAGFFKDVYKVTCDLKELFNSDSFDIASFGDATDHFHVHIVPKFKGTELWGKPYYIEDAPFIEESTEKLEEIIEMIHKKVGGKHLD